jgi:hypothetical protein
MNTIPRLEIITKYVSEVGLIFLGSLLVVLNGGCPPFCIERIWPWFETWLIVLGIGSVFIGATGLIINILAANKRNLMNQ